MGKAISSTIVPESTTFDVTNELFQKFCVFTGTLENMSRKEAMQKLANVGGFPQDKINSDTDYVIMANNGVITGKIKEAQERGIGVITEDQFNYMLENGKGINQTITGFSSLEEIIDLLETTSDDVQRVLGQVVFTTITRRNPKEAIKLTEEESKWLLKNNIIIVSNSFEKAISCLKYGEIRKTAKDMGITLRTRTKNETIDELNEVLSDDEKSSFSKTAGVFELSPEIKRFIKKVYTYLRRKFEDEMTIDSENGVIDTRPCGAEKVIVSGRGECFTYKDSEVTRLLIKHNALREGYEWYFDFLN